MKPWQTWAHQTCWKEVIEAWQNGESIHFAIQPNIHKEQQNIDGSGIYLYYSQISLPSFISWTHWEYINQWLAKPLPSSSSVRFHWTHTWMELFLLAFAFENQQRIHSEGMQLASESTHRAAIFGFYHVFQTKPLKSLFAMYFSFAMGTVLLQQVRHQTDRIVGQWTPWVEYNALTHHIMYQKKYPCPVVFECCDNQVTILLKTSSIKPLVRAPDPCIHVWSETTFFFLMIIGIIQYCLASVSEDLSTVESSFIRLTDQEWSQLQRSFFSPVHEFLSQWLTQTAAFPFLQLHNYPSKHLTTMPFPVPGCSLVDMEHKGKKAYWSHLLLEECIKRFQLPLFNIVIDGPSTLNKPGLVWNLKQKQLSFFNCDPRHILLAKQILETMIHGIE